MALPIFAITIFVSAFLLFLVQPLIGKLILPKLGGTPQVWNTCMVFFQSTLLLGYAYTHSITTRLKFRQQLMVHAGLLIIPIVMLLIFPIYTEVQGWSPPPGANPIISTLVLLATIIGVPFFVVSTSAPLLQKWFGYSGHSTAQDPYFLYSVSNLGSLLSLLLYPILIEPLTVLSSQSYIFFAGYIALAGLILFCAYTINKLAPTDEAILATEAVALPPVPVPETPASLSLALPPAPAPAPSVETAVKSGQPAGGRGIQRKKGAKLPAKVMTPEDKAPAREVLPDITHGADAPMSWFRRLRWVMLAFVPSSLMLGVTSYISTDMSPFPLVWVIPLALYLVSFILVYDKYVQWTSKRYHVLGGRYTLQQMTVYVLQPIGLIALCYVILKGGFDPVFSTFVVMLGFFANALACHGELAQDRPSTRNLTEYFLLMSFGGMVGGVFNGIMAPVVFQTGVLEFYIVIVVACLVRPQYVPTGWFDDLILQAFPGFRTWVTGQGDEMAKSMGRPAPRSTYMFSFFLDIVLGAFILTIAWYLRTKYYTAGAQKSWLISGLNFVGFKDDPQTGVPAGFQFLRSALTMGPPLVFAFFFAGRPLRSGLAMAGILVGSIYFAEGDRGVLEARRTYFGLLRVMQEEKGPRDPDERKDFILKGVVKDGESYAPSFMFNYLMHGTTYHGRNYVYEPRDAAYTVDLSRLATTYYHRYGPVGIVMERYNWFPGKQNNFAADARMPATLIGQMTASIGVGTLPLDAIVDGWSEPPIATIGLGTGTMASYSRPYQFCTYYEIDDVMRRFSLPEGKDKVRFTYLENAIRRGVNLEVIMGDARLSLEKTREENNGPSTRAFRGDFSESTLKKLHTDRQTVTVTSKGIDHEYTLTEETTGFGVDGKGLKDRMKSLKEGGAVIIAPTSIDDKDVLKDIKMVDDYAGVLKNRLYASVPYEPVPSVAPSRNNFYKVIVVDAFSSDAIPIHLVTKQAIKIYLDKLTEDGVLCVHTSNRHLDLVRPVARIAKELSDEAVAAAKAKAKETGKDIDEDDYRIYCKVGKDRTSGDDRELFMGLFSSEYVMIYRDKKNAVRIPIPHEKVGGYFDEVYEKHDKLFNEWREENPKEDPRLWRAPAGQPILYSKVEWYDPYKNQSYQVRGGGTIVWHRAVTAQDSLWTDDYSHILGVVRLPSWLSWLNGT